MLHLDPHRTALVMIDLQNWIVSRPVAPHSGDDVVDRSLRIAKALRKAGGVVMLVRVLFSEGYGDVVKVPVDSPLVLPENRVPPEAVAFDARINPAEADVIITKRQWSAPARHRNRHHQRHRHQFRGRIHRARCLRP
jgi:nicotinamidase-related amidase